RVHLRSSAGGHTERVARGWTRGYFESSIDPRTQIPYPQPDSQHRGVLGFPQSAEVLHMVPLAGHCSLGAGHCREETVVYLTSPRGCSLRKRVSVPDVLKQQAAPVSLWMQPTPEGQEVSDSQFVCLSRAHTGLPPRIAEIVCE
ncbi:hypothetical protein PMAYCL1PPCAC_28213, partial [Pristionchus mayeri]